MRKRIYKAVNLSAMDKYLDQSYAKIVLVHHMGSVKYEYGGTSSNDTVNTEGSKEADESIEEIANSVLDAEISEERFKFDSSQEPHSAFNIFVKCVENGYYPPSDVLKFISGKFQKYLNGDRTFDKVMGVNKRSKLKYEINSRNTEIVREIDTLKYQFGISTDHAFHAVSSRFYAAGTPLGSDAIIDIYYREGKKLLENSLQLGHDDFTILSELEVEEIAQWCRSYLSKYPNDVIDFLKKEYKWAEIDGILTNIKPNYNVSRFEKSPLADESEDSYYEI